MVVHNICHDYIYQRYDIENEEWPPNQPKSIVNLALIHYKGGHVKQHLIEVSKHNKGDTHTIPYCKDIAEIFKNSMIEETNNKVQKIILIEGAPGIGKTVLSRQIAYSWAKKGLLCDIDILFLLFLRDPVLQSITKAEQLIQYFSAKHLDEEQIDSCKKEIMKRKVCIVIDGLDEFPTPLRKGSFIADIINNKVFPNSVVVLTSRPVTCKSLHHVVNVRVEILGFAQEERDKYISESLHSPEQRKLLQEYLKCQPIINSLLCVPLHLTFFLYSFKVENKLPKTLTELNEAFILLTIHQNLTKTQGNAVTVVNSIKDLPKNVLDVINKLSKLAFTGLQNNQLVFSHDDLKDIFSHNGLDKVETFGLLQGFYRRKIDNIVSFNFPHYTIQQYLAALHVATTSHEQQLSLMKRTFWSSKYNFMWMMYAGMNGINSQAFTCFLYKAQQGDDITKLILSCNVRSDKLKCLHVFQYFLEAESKEVPKEMSCIFYKNEVNLQGVKLLPHDVLLLTSYLCKCSMQLQFLNLRDCHIDNVGMNTLALFLNTYPDKASNIKHVDLFGNDSTLLWSIYGAIFKQQSLARLNWSSLGKVNFDDIVTVMDNNMIVQLLDVSDNYFNDHDVRKLAKNITTLQELDLSNNCLSTRRLTALSNSLQHIDTLQCLNLSWNDINVNKLNPVLKLSKNCMTDIDAQIVTAIACCSKIFFKLDLSRNKISDDSAVSISQCIKCNVSVTILDLSRNAITSDGIKMLEAALQMNSTLQTLNISHNHITDKGAVTISNCLNINAVLQELNLSHNKIYDKGIISIVKSIRKNRTLKLLDISRNTISNDGIFTISKYLRSNPLQKFKISWNNIHFDLNRMIRSFNMANNHFGYVGAILVSTFLHRNTKTQTIDISCNDISDDGAVAISKCLSHHSKLVKLDISKNKISDDGIVAICNALRNNTQVCMLNMSYIDISDAGTLAISDLIMKNKTIKELHISHSEISNNRINKISEALLINTQLTVLDISHIKISYKGAEAICEFLKKNATLQELDISHNEINNNGIIGISEALKINRQLKYLNLSHTNIADEGVIAISESLKNNETLSELNISQNKVLNTGFISIGKVLNINKTLKILDVSQNILSDDGVLKFSKYLRNENKLHKLRISWDGTCILDINSNFKSLNMNQNGFMDTGAVLIAALLSCNINVVKLDISSNNISDDGAVAISECLKNNNILGELNLSHNRVSDIGITKLCEALEINSSLKILDISYNNMCDDGVIAMGRILGGHYKNDEITNKTKYLINEDNIHGAFEKCTLLYLNMSYNQISSEGIVAFSDFLMINFTLKCLELSWDNYNIPIILEDGNSFLDMSNKKIGDTGCILISAFLFNNNTIQKLDLSYTNISDDGVLAISECLKINRTLTELYISNNKITNHGIVKITEAIKINTTLKFLDISQNHLFRCKKVATVLNDHLKYNSTLQVLGISWNETDDRYIYTVDMNYKCCCVDSTWPQYAMTINNTQHVWDYKLKCYPRFYQDFNNPTCNTKILPFGYTEAILLTTFTQDNTDEQALEILRKDVSYDAVAVIKDNFQETIQHLKLFKCSLSSKAIKPFIQTISNNSTSLKILEISSVSISDDEVALLFENLKNNKTLTYLNISGNSITVIGAKIIGDFLLENTTLLNLLCCENKILDDGGLAIGGSLASNKTLKRLCLSCNKITSHGVIKIIQVDSILQKLDISHNNILDDGAVSISKYLIYNRKFKSVNLCGNNITWCGTSKLAEAIKLNSSLLKLNISDNHICAKGATAISECLKVNKTLKKLDTSWNWIGSNGAVTIAAAIQINVSLQKLDMSHNNIFRDTATVLGSYLKHNSTLQELLISWNDIDITNLYISATKCHVTATWPYIVFHNFTQYVVHNHSSAWPWHDRQLINANDTMKPNLTELQFDHAEAMLLISHAIKNVKNFQIVKCKISDSAALVLSEFLEVNNSIRVLELSWNTISSKAIKQIINAIQFNTTLQMLDISSNNISDDGAVAISKCLTCNKVIKVLDISKNNIAKGIEIIGYSIQENTVLQDMYLFNNKMCDDDVVAFSKCLTKNSTLQKLNISWTNTTTKSINMISKAIARNTGLQTLDFSLQLVNEPVYFTMTLLAAMNQNSTIKRLVLPSNVNTSEAMIQAKLKIVNDERMKRGQNVLVLDKQVSNLCLGLATDIFLIFLHSYPHVFKQLAS